MDQVRSFEPVLAALLAMGSVVLVFWCGTWIGRNYGGWSELMEHVLARVELELPLRRSSEEVVWLVLQYPNGYTPDVKIGGIFRTEAAALAVAAGELDVVGPVMLNVKEPADVVWSGAYYPNLGQAGFTNSGMPTAKVEVVGPTYAELLLALGSCRSVMPDGSDVVLDEERG